MARVITTEPLKIQERTTVCKNCNSKVAFNEKEVFLDLSYGPEEHNGEECITCPHCHYNIHIGVFQAIEHM